MDLETLRIFLTVAELASFSRAAERLALQKGRVSTSVQRLETQLGSRLFHRTTRTVRLTPDGEQFLERARQLLADADELEAMFQQTPAALRGRLRIDLPTAIARNVVIPRLPEFLGAHPQLEVVLSTTDRRVDVVHDGFDCVLRVGPLHDSGLVARRLGELAQINCASPAYLRKHGTPRTLDDLDRHWLVRYSPTLDTNAGWEYRDGGHDRVHPMRGVITVNGTDAYQAACLAGLGIIQVPVTGVQHLLAEGLLVDLMPEFTGAPLPVSLLYPHRHQPRRVQAFIAWLADVIGRYLQSARR